MSKMPYECVNMRTIEISQCTDISKASHCLKVQNARLKLDSTVANLRDKLTTGLV